MGWIIGHGNSFIFRQGGGNKWSSYWTTHIPTNLSVIWVDDYAQMTWDITGTRGQYEIWESLNGGAYSLVATTGIAVNSYLNYTYQNATMKFKVRGVGGGEYSVFSNEITLVTPLVIPTRQTTLNQAKFNNLNTTVGQVITVDWGDGNTVDLSGTNTNITHDYGATAANYYVKITGQTNHIIQLYAYQWTSIHFDIGKWIKPTAMTWGMYFIKVVITGDPSRFLVGSQLSLLLDSCSSWNVGSMSGDLSVVTNMAGLYQLRISNAPLITGLPTGVLKNLDMFDFSGCGVSQAKLLEWLEYASDYFDVTAPLSNCTYSLHGASMGIISATNEFIVNIKARYVAAGKVATFNVNDPAVAYQDKSSKSIIILPIYDGQGQSIHPSVLNLGGAWQGYQYYLGDTPYTFANVATERVSLFASNDGVNWVVPTNFPNPIKANSNADPDIFYEGGTMYMVYLGSKSQFLMSKTTDGIAWSAEVEVKAAGTDTLAVSPAMTKIGSDYYIYYNDQVAGNNNVIRRRSCATPDGTYGASEACVFGTAPTYWWHIDIFQYNAKFYLMASSANAIYIGVSDDGVNFTNVEVLLSPTWWGYELGQFYRPSGMWIGSDFYVYYSILQSNGYCRVYRCKITFI